MIDSTRPIAPCLPAEITSQILDQIHLIDSTPPKEHLDFAPLSRFVSSWRGAGQKRLFETINVSFRISRSSKAWQIEFDFKVSIMTSYYLYSTPFTMLYKKEIVSSSRYSVLIRFPFTRVLSKFEIPEPASMSLRFQYGRYYFFKEFTISKTFDYWPLLYRSRWRESSF